MSFSDIGVESLDLSGLDTSKVVNMHGAFDHMPYAKSLNLSGLDTHNVTDMSSMFWVSDKLEHLDLSSFDTSKVTDMSGMFFGMSGLKTLELGNFDTHNVTDMSSMFYSLYELKKLDVSHFDTSKVTDMESMFAHAESLEKLDVSHFNTSQVTDMRRMFANLPKLKELDVSNFDTRKVTDMSGMFSSMEELKELDLSNFETYNVRDMGSMFYETKNLEALNLSNFDISKLKDHSYSSDKPNVFAFDRSPKLRLVNLANLDISNSSEKVRASLAGALNNRQGAVAIVAKPEVFKLMKTDNSGTVIGPQYEAGEGRFQNGSATLNLVKSQNIDPAELYAALPTQTELANVESPVLAGYKLKNWSLISDEVDDLSRLGLKGYAPKFKTVRYQAAYEPLKETDAGIVTYVPKAKDLTVRVNEDPVAPEAIANKEELPSNTKYAWKEKVDTTTIGAKFGTLIVTYPNGAKEEVVVKITVIAADPVVDTTASKSELEQGSAKGFSPHIKQESDKAPAHTNASDEKQSLPQLGDANANLSLIAGVLVAGVASLLGASLIVNRKR
nr:BspA family leucine-rich repeat surface protein [Ligilactobacillus murinus]